MNTVCFSGHRILPENKKELIRERLRQVIRAHAESGTIFFACGGAIGFDMMAAEEVLKVQEEILPRKIYLILLLPFPYYTSRWNYKDKKRLNAILNKAIYKYVSPSYEKGVYFKRDRIMIEGSDTCIYYCTNPNSGTGYTVEHAKKNSLFLSDIGDDALFEDNFFENLSII